jgi:tetratricopeptide (TPR) repeat protein
VLQHDLIGRQYEVGSDYDGAIEAYKKVLDLDSKDVTSRVNYAVLLEYGPDGVHYASTHLDEAVKQIRAVKEQDAELGARYDLNVIVDLFFAGQFQKMLDAASALGDSEAIRQYRIAATSVLSSSDQAIQMANSSSSDEATRVRLLAGAGQFLLRTRHYKKAVALLEAASGNATASALAQQMQVLRNARPLEENTIPETDPRSPAQRILRMMTGGVDSSDRTLDAILSKQFWRTTRHENMKRAIEVSKGMLQSEMKRGETSRQVFADLVDSSIRYTVDGDEQSGFRVRATPIMGEPIDLIVIREDAQYKVLAMKPDYAPVGLEALERLSHSDVEGARKMLEWVRANVSVTNGEDPLAGQTFPRIWSRGDQGDAAHIELAAAALVADQSDRFDQVARLEKVLASATDRYEEAASLSLAHLYLRTKQWDKALPLLKPLAERYPESNSVFLSEFRAMRHLGRAPEAVALAQQRLKRAPDDDTLVENLADAYAAAGQFDKASDTLKVIAESGHATSNLLNSYAWMATFLPVPPQPAVEAAERANAMTNSENFAILHTLACLYAAGGKPLEARDLLLKAMTAAHMSQPDREVWFGFARIAEQYGDYETAAAEYARVTSTDVDNEGPTSTFTLAQKQIGALKSAGKVTDKATANGN